MNCYGPELAIFDPAARKDPARAAAYPAAPTSRRLYAMGEAIREIVEASPYRVLVCPSSTWSHTWLTSRYDRMRMDVEGNLDDPAARSSAARASGCATTTARRSRRTATTSCATGSSARARWARRKLEVTWYRASWVSTGFRVFGVWH